MTATRRMTRRLRSRKGATLVMTAILMTVMVGFVGVGVDFARMYAFKAQVQVAADAGAIAGAIELLKGRKTAFIVDTSSKYALLNKVEGGNLVTVDPADVQPMHYDFTTHASTVTPGWSDAATNAVRVTARYQASYTFGKIFSIAPSTLDGQAQAALGFVGTTNCLKPWAVSYSALLQSLPAPANTADPTTYNLTASDVQYLATNQAPVAFQMDNSNPTAPGNIANVQVSTPWNGNNSYSNAISGGGCANLPVGPGTWLDSSPAEGSGTTTNSVRSLCGVNGNGQNAFNCNQTVKLAVWDYNNGQSGAGLKYHVKFVGVFVVTRYDPGNGGGPNTTPERVTGYFSSMPDPNGGTVSGTPSPLQSKPVLVL